MLWCQVSLDIHYYHSFGIWNILVVLPNYWDINLSSTCVYHIELVNSTLPTFHGEWSLAVTDCQLYLQVMLKC